MSSSQISSELLESALIGVGDFPAGDFRFQGNNYVKEKSSV